MSDQLPLHGLEAAQTALGAAMPSAGALAVVLELLGAEDFWRPAHRSIYRAMHGLVDGGDPADVVIVGTELDRRRALATSAGRRSCTP